jgi:chromosomal replication initiator protein
MNTNELWEKCLSEVELSISKANFTTWFKNTSIVKEEAGTLYVGVPNEFVKDWLYNKFHKLILKTIINHEDGIRSIEYIIHKNDNSTKNTENIFLKEQIENLKKSKNEVSN